ncbi:MAG: cell division protein ZapA [Bacillota bacterium]|nr:cell division protein ZapA [Bacillota bacterium]
MIKTNTVTVQVAGKSYQLTGFDEKEHFTLLADVVNRRISETASQNPSLNAEACAVAVCLSLADELIKAQALAARLRRQLDEIKKDSLDET